MAFKFIKKAMLGTALIGSVFAGVAFAAGDGDHGAYEMKHPHWHFTGMFGTYDREAMQRGYQVYREVCSACHALEHLAFRHLGDPGGPFYSEDYPNPTDSPLIKGLAAEWDVPMIDSDTGDADIRTGLPADEFPDIFPNAIAAAASNGGVAPPDLSVITKARTDGSNYLYNLMMAYGLDLPHDGSVTIGPGQYYNPVMEGGVIAMAPPLIDGQVTYEGENAPDATVEQMAADVTEFLTWAGDPKMEQRKRAGFATLLYLCLLSILLYMSYQRVWRNVEH